MSIHYRHLADSTDPRGPWRRWIAPRTPLTLALTALLALVALVGCGSPSMAPDPDPRAQETAASVPGSAADTAPEAAEAPEIPPIAPSLADLEAAPPEPEPATPAPPPAPELPQEARALWVVRDALARPETVRQMVEDAAGAGITDLLVQIRGRGDAWYRSDLVPTARRVAWTQADNPGFDPFALTLELAHARGMRVHAWMNVYLVWGKGTPPAGHVAAEHRDWVAEDLDGRRMDSYSLSQLLDRQTEGTYLEPGNHAVVAHFEAVVAEVLDRYPVDGIHLDYVRYPQMDVGYSRNMRAGFHRMTGVDPVTLRTAPETIARERGEAELIELEREWIAFKASQVTALVARVHAQVREKAPGALVSAAVKPDPETARERNGQDWLRWIDEGLVDVVTPMMYSTRDETVERQARDLASRVPTDRIWAGIAVYNQSLAGAASKIRHVKAAGIPGISIFSYNSIPGGAAGLSDLGRVR